MFSAIEAILQLPVTSLGTLVTTKEISSFAVLSFCFSSVCCSAELIVSFVPSSTLSFVPVFPKIAARITTTITQNHHFLKIGFLTPFLVALSFIMPYLQVLVDISIIAERNTKVQYNFNSLLCHSFMCLVNTIM